MYRRRAFTLVELLVVIGIIAVLIAMLLPALSRARAQAMSVQCMSNLRQIMIHVQLYANDYNGAMVPAMWTGDSVPSPLSAGYPSYWNAAFPSDAIFLGRYSCDMSRGLVFGVGKQPVWGNLTTPDTIWRCPTVLPATAAGTNLWWYNTTYALNLQVFPYISRAVTKKATGWENCWRLGSVKEASRLMAFVDSSGTRFDCGWPPSAMFYGNPGGATSPVTAIAYSYNRPGSAYNHAIRHPSNGTNAAFMDGHVETLQNTPQTATYPDGIGLKAAFDAGLFILNRK